MIKNPHKKKSVIVEKDLTPPNYEAVFIITSWHTSSCIVLMGPHQVLGLHLHVYTMAWRMVYRKAENPIFHSAHLVQCSLSTVNAA
jgi:hypothetical protein